MSRQTLADLRASRAAQTLGVCADSAEFTAYANEAIQRLIWKGRWKGSYQRIRLCVTDGCLTLPKGIAALTDIAVCGHPVSLRNQWWEFLSGNGYLHEGMSTGCSCPGPSFVDKGWVASFDDIIPGNKKLRLYMSVDLTDVGKKVLLQGYDENNLWVRSLDGSTWIDGIYLTLADPYVETTFDWNNLTGVIKPLTNHDILLYEVASDGTQRQLARYEPSETSPSLRRYHFRNLAGWCGNSCCSDAFTIDALATLEFYPMSVATDYLYIDNIPAIKEMAQSIRYSEMDSSSAKQQAILHEARALKALQSQQQSLTPDDSIAISMKTQGSALLSHKNIGRLM